MQYFNKVVGSMLFALCHNAVAHSSELTRSSSSPSSAGDAVDPDITRPLELDTSQALQNYESRDHHLAHPTIDQA